VFERLLFAVAFIVALVAALWIPVKSIHAYSGAAPAALSVTSKTHPGGKE